MRNLLSIPLAVSPEGAEEFFETLFSGAGGLQVERIISHGHSTPEGEWYDQERDEWVTVLKGSACIGYPDGSEVVLQHGGTLFLPKHCRHRVRYTSSPCIWLAIHHTDMRFP